MKVPNSKLYFYLFLGSLFILPKLHATSDSIDYVLDFLTVEKGLSQSTVNTLAQDKRGFLWIGTQDGLNCYDGHQFKIYKKDPFDTTSISDNYITSILIDSKDQLWAGTKRSGVNLFDPVNGKFSRFSFNPKSEQALPGDRIDVLQEDALGNIWVGTTRGLHCIQPQVNGSYKSIKLELPKMSLKDREAPVSITSIFPYDNKHILIGTIGGFYKIQLDDKNEMESFDWFPMPLPSKKFEKIVNNFYQIPNGNWLIGTSSGLYFWNGQDRAYTLITLPGLSRKYSEIKINKFASFADGELLVATVSGVFKFDPNDLASSGVQIYPREKASWKFQTPTIIALLQDRLHPGLIWLGTEVSGLAKFAPRQVHFHSDYLYNVSRKHGVSPSVFHLVEDDSERIWAGGLEGGIYIKDKKNKSYSFHQTIQLKDRKIPLSYLSSLYKDDQGNIWGGFLFGLMKLTLQNGKINGEFFQIPKGCESRFVQSIYQHGSYLYLGGLDGISIFDLKQEAYISCSIPIKGKVKTSSEESYYGNRVTTMLIDQQNHLWAGCDNGLFVISNIDQFNPNQENEFNATYYYQQPKNPNSLSDNMINHIIEDKSNQIWIGTMNGLAKATIQEDKVSFSNFYEKHGLANNVIYGILAEPDGEYLWLSTNNGLSRFHPQKHVFFNYKKKDGLQSSEFNTNAFHVLKDGRLAFGGVNGYTTFYPKEVKMATYSPPVWITSLSTFEGRHFHLLNEAKSTPVILDHSENSFAVHFTGLDFLHPDEVEYFYDLEGGTAKDVHIGQRQQIEFNQLAPGKYNFCVKARGKDGVLNSIGDNLEIHILTPYWQQSWFYWLCAGGILLISSLIYHTFYKIKMAQIAEIEQVRKAAAEDFHDELGSKLSIISMFSELTRAHLNTNDKQVATYLDRITVTSSSLYESMRDMLWALNPEQDTIRDLFFQIKDFGEELFSHSNTSFHSTGIQPGWSRQNIPMQYKRHVLLMCKEALHNSLRHAQAEHVSLQMDYQNHTLQLNIQDDGKGFNTDQAGRGEGLTNMETRARRIKGTFQVESNGKGTCITITCPMS